jgi:hypothetical protein
MKTSQRERDHFGLSCPSRHLQRLDFKPRSRRIASAVSQPDSRVNRGKFAAGVADLQLPVDAALGAVDVG